MHCYADLSVENATQWRRILLKCIFSFYCTLSVFNVSMDRPVEKMHVNELKELLRSKNVSLKELTVKAQLDCLRFHVSFR